MLESNDDFSTDEKENLVQMLQQADKEIEALVKIRLQLARLNEYNDVKRKEPGTEGRMKILAIKEADDKTIEEANKFLEEHLLLRDYMFGYPAAMTEDNSVTTYLKNIESKLYYMNNCGDSSPLTRGNYQMDSKVYEQKTLDLFYENLGVKAEDYWGYITSGGTEDNFWGLRTGFEIYPNGTLYFSEDAHYSIPKFTRLIDKKKDPDASVKIFNDCQIPSINGKIDTEKLLETIIKKYDSDHSPAIISLTWGTTVLGNIDDVEYISNKLKELDIPHYIHLDAALYGGIPKNQVNAPIIKNLEALGVDSVSISLHKYLGASSTNGILICKKDVLNKKNNLQIEYIGQEDPTYLGSRNFVPLSTYNKIMNLYQRTDENDYEKNINYFMQRADEKGLEYSRIGNGNIIVLKLKNKELAKKYQLATFGENNGYAHIIIFPHHKQEIIDELIDDFAPKKELILSR